MSVFEQFEKKFAVRQEPRQKRSQESWKRKSFPTQITQTAKKIKSKNLEKGQSLRKGLREQADKELLELANLIQRRIFAEKHNLPVPDLTTPPKSVVKEKKSLSCSAIIQRPNFNYSFKSPDKKEIIPFLSCEMEDFDEEPKLQVILPDDSSKKSIEEEYMSPDIEDVSDSELPQKDGSVISSINNRIGSIYNKKNYTRKKPLHNGSLLQKFRDMKDADKSKELSFLTLTGDVVGQRKIEILSFNCLYNRCLAKFRFLDCYDYDFDVRQYFIYAPAIFDDLFKLHKIYQIAPQWNPTEVTRNKFVYCTNLIKAGST